MTKLLSRRDFLRMSSTALAGLAFKPLSARFASQPPIFYGRAIVIYITVYSRPSAFARTVNVYNRETVLPIYAEVEGEDIGAYNRRWYQTAGGYIHSSNVQPVAVRPNWPVVISKPTLGEITLPFADARAKPRYAADTIYRLYYSTTHWVQRSHVDDSGQIWYELWDDRVNGLYFVPGGAVRLVAADEFTPLSPRISDKKIHIDVTAQTITAFENEAAVHTARISSGAIFEDPSTGRLKDFRTPLGEYAINRKRPSRHMVAGDGVADDSYDLPGVPWVSYFNGGIALHGTYWHNDYGRAWSHGCINLTPPDAKWFFRWTMPAVPPNQSLVEERGTPVLVG